MGLLHICTKYGYLKEHKKHMHDKEFLSPNDMSHGKSSQPTCQIGLGKSCYENNMNHQTYVFANSTQHIKHII